MPVIKKETKPGYLTTEFWITILTLILNNLSVLPVPDKYQGLINIASVVGYQLSRGLAKQGVPAVDEEASGDQETPLTASIPVTPPTSIAPDQGDAGPAS